MLLFQLIKIVRLISEVLISDRLNHTGTLTGSHNEIARHNFSIQSMNEKIINYMIKPRLAIYQNLNIYLTQYEQSVIDSKNKRIK
jgi:hypothetical protein